MDSNKPNLPYLSSIKALNITAPYNLIGVENTDIIPKINILSEKEFNKYLIIARQYEPLLQPGMLFDDVDGLKIIDDIRESKIKDDLFVNFAPRSFICESYCELAKNIVLKLNVTEDDYGKVIDFLNDEVLNDQEIQSELKSVEENIKIDFDKYKNSEEFVNDKNEFIKKHNIKEDTIAIDRLVLNQKLKTLVENSDVSKIIDNHFSEIIQRVNDKNQNLNLDLKDPAKTAAHDGYALGAPASGKSKVVKDYLIKNIEEAKNTITINPDTNRIFSVNKLFGNKNVSSQILRENNAFITNSLSDVISDMCYKECEENKKNRNISLIIDKTGPNSDLMKRVLKDDAKLIMGAYYGNATPQTGPAFRAFNRANKADNAIDARSMRTSHTLKMHRDYLTNIIKNNGPEKIKNDIVIVDTAGKDLSPGHKPVEIAIIKKTGEIEVKDPRFIEFIAKANINIDAKHPIEVSMVQTAEGKKWTDQFKQSSKEGKLEMLKTHKSDVKLFYDFEDKIKAAEDFTKLSESKGFKVVGMEGAIQEYRDNEIYKNFGPAPKVPDQVLGR